MLFCAQAALAPNGACVTLVTPKALDAMIAYTCLASQGYVLAYFGSEQSVETLDWGERSEPLPSQPNVNFVCIYLSIYLSIYVCHGPARY